MLIADKLTNDDDGANAIQPLVDLFYRFQDNH